jgi:hypothetical protein
VHQDSPDGDFAHQARLASQLERPAHHLLVERGLRGNGCGVACWFQGRFVAICRHG